MVVGGRIDLGFADRTAVVTGGARRLEIEDCRVHARQGADVIALDVDLEGAETVADELVEEYDATAHAVECALTDREDVTDTVAALEAETGSINVPINTAGPDRYRRDG